MKPLKKINRRAEKRLKDYEETAKRLSPKQARGYKKPGSRKRVGG